MPATMTFDSLKSDLRSYLERGSAADATVYAQLPALINLAERNIAREMKIQGFITSVTGTFTSGADLYQKPLRWRETISMMYGTGSTRAPIFPREYGYCRAYWPTSTDTSAPKFYADFDATHWLVVPTPDSNYNFEVMYYEMPALLDDTNTTNWLTIYAPQLLLYRALAETAAFIRDDASFQKYMTLYGQAKAALTEEDMRHIVDRTTTRQQA